MHGPQDRASPSGNVGPPLHLAAQLPGLPSIVQRSLYHLHLLSASAEGNLSFLNNRPRAELGPQDLAHPLPNLPQEGRETPPIPAPQPIRVEVATAGTTVTAIQTEATTPPRMRLLIGCRTRAPPTFLRAFG